VCHTDLQGSKSTKFTKYVDNWRNNMSANNRPVVNSDATIRKRGALQKNLLSNQRAWRPPGVPKTWITESAMSLQSISQKKSSQSVEKSSVSMKNKLSTEQIEYIFFIIFYFTCIWNYFLNVQSLSSCIRVLFQNERIFLGILCIELLDYLSLFFNFYVFTLSI